VNNKERGERIRLQILRDIKYHPTDIAKHIGNIFSITPQAVYNHIKRLEKDGCVLSTGRGKGRKLFLGDVRTHRSIFQLNNEIAEDKIWRDHYSFIFEGLSDTIADICHYGFTEMVNNAIDHSGGTEVYIDVFRGKDQIVIVIIDNGEGIFKQIKRLCNLTDERQALLELSKGKLTTDPDNHSGEGIFFTSRVFDRFDIDSKGMEFSHDHTDEYDFLSDSNIPEDEVGTMVYMRIKRSSTREIQNIFNEYTEGPEDFKFNKTVIPLRLAQYKNEKLVSRSQAKRVLIRVEKFENVIFDFTDIESIGQAFADEIFRVYAQKHSGITLLPVHMTTDVEKMVKRAISGLNKMG